MVLGALLGTDKRYKLKKCKKMSQYSHEIIAGNWSHFHTKSMFFSKSVWLNKYPAQQMIYYSKEALFYDKLHDL